LTEAFPENAPRLKIPDNKEEEGAKEKAEKIKILLQNIIKKGRHEK